ncbi:serine/threonine-protein kinase [Microbacterium aerolatum]|uniref:non-specific serine/threonine protein kinase n=1 Tax=Microbacterium aerolatum TaxID=153731 RepID=A0A511AMZ8_9MICO|nr:serine/threonine-protein kinase [Microbacterium aerolatum]GEK87217.1 serine/threonine protein kinase [Microbacterium aerolatum]GGB35141.1 serine/threonine protein kinase [Microbacterium aerolatum]
MNTVCDEPTEAVLDGRYSLGEHIGRGATATVYRAEDMVLGRTVAIKLLRGPDEQTASADRARTESAVLASLNHPALVTLYDARLDPEHPRYLAMEYVDGPTLATRLSRGALSRTEAALLALNLAQALEVVHEAGIIHRDVKPSNVLLAPGRRAGTWTPKLTDFGIAFGPDDARLTSPGVAIGTAAYMAPEQVEASELTPAVDVYSLGLVLLEALTGQPAFPVAGQVQTALRRLTASPEIPEGLGSEWTDLLTRMTRTRPDERPTAAEVAESVSAMRVEAGTAPMTAPLTAAAAAAGESTAATRAYTAESPAPRSRGRRIRAGMLAGAGALAVASIVLTGMWATGTPNDSPARVATFVSLDPQPEPADAETEPEPDASTPQETTNTTTVDDEQSNQGNSDKVANPNKGPGNNSGNSEKSNNGKKDD